MTAAYRRSGPGGANASPRRGRARRIGLAILLIALAIAAVCCWRLFLRDPDRELPPEQKIRRNFRRAFDPDESTLERLASLRRTFRAARDIPPDKRHPIIIEALAESVNRSFTDFAQLPPERKPEQAERLLRDAEQTRKYFRSFPRDKQKQALAILAGTPGGRAQIDRAIDLTANGFGPEDRRLLGPAIKVWKDMLEDRK